MKHRQSGSAYFQAHTIDHEMKEKAIRSGGSMLFSRSVNTLIQMASTVILARLLTPEDFGLVAMVTAFSFLLANVGFNGFTEAIIQTDDVTHDQVSTLFWIGLAISVGLAILFSACSPLLAHFYNEPRLTQIAMVFSVGFVFSGLATEHLALIMRKMEFHKIVVNEILSAIISVAIAIWMALSGFGYWAIVARQVSLPVLGAIIAWIQCRWRPGFPQRNSGIRPMMRYAINTFGNFTVDYLGKNLDKVLLGKRWGSQELGNYDRAYRLFVLPVNQMTIPLTGVALATLSRLRRDPVKYRHYYLKSVSMLSLIGMLVSSVMTVAGRDIIYILLGPQWVKSGLIFSALGPSIGISLIYNTHGWLHLSLGNANRWFKWGAFAFILTAIALLVGLQFGALGVALAYGLSFYILAPPGLSFAGKPIGIRFSDIWQAIWKHFVSFLLSGLMTWVAVNNISVIAKVMASFPALARLFFTGVSCTIIYLISVIALSKSAKPIMELIKMARLMLPGSRGTSAPLDNDGTTET